MSIRLPGPGAVGSALLFTLIAGPVLAGGTTYIVRGGAMGSFSQHLDVYDQDWTPIETATVSVNGVDIPHVSGSRYSGTLKSALSEADPVTVTVDVDAVTVTGVDVLPHSAVVTAPLDGAEFIPGDPLTITWTSATDPDRFNVSPFPCDGACSVFVDGSVRTLEFDTSSFPLDEPVEIRVYAYNDGEFSGPAAPECQMWLRYWAGNGPEVTAAKVPTETTSWTTIKALHR